jgi:hypothetical protein
MLNHGIEVAIVVQQSVIHLDAERTDDQINRFAGRDAKRP